jgi:type I restriction enzyme M protein
MHKTKTSDFLGRYYTDSSVSALLVDALNIARPKKVLDLGAGDGALVSAAAKVWSKASYFTVDIDKNAKSARFPELHGSLFKHHVGDALSTSIGEELGLKPKSADVALCNPPYIRPKWRQEFSQILEEAGLSHIFPKMSDVTADILFIAQNLRFLKGDGRLGLIVPDGLITGERFGKIRACLAKNHSIERIIELPRRIFKKTDAKAHILIINKASDKFENIRIQRLDEGSMLSNEILVPTSLASQRLDYSFLMNQDNLAYREGAKIREVTSLLKRGNVSSSMRDSLPYPVLHTSDIGCSSEFVEESFLLNSNQESQVTGIVAIPGDILLGRVGRNLHEKVCRVRGGNIAISDCIFLLRVDTKYRNKVFKFLKSKNGQFALSNATQGVGAKFLTTGSILNIQFSVELKCGDVKN